MEEKDCLLKGYRREDKLIDMKKANIVGSVYAVIVFIITIVLHGVLWGSSETIFSVQALILSIVLIFLHEVCHCIGYLRGDNVSFKDVKIGFNIKQLMPYAHCKKVLDVKKYRFAVMLPTFVTGVLPLLIGLSLGKMYLTVAGSFLIASGIGDLMIWWAIRNCSDGNLIYDHPTEAGCIVYVKEK